MTLHDEWILVLNKKSGLRLLMVTQECSSDPRHLMMGTTVASSLIRVWVCYTSRFLPIVLGGFYWQGQAHILTNEIYHSIMCCLTTNVPSALRFTLVLYQSTWGIYGIFAMPIAHVLSRFSNLQLSGQSQKIQVLTFYIYVCLWQPIKCTLMFVVLIVGYCLDDNI